MTYRVGNHNARHVYRGDQEIAVAFTEDDGRLIADALNAAEGSAERGCFAQRTGAGDICQEHGCVYPGDKPGVTCRGPRHGAVI